MNEIDIQGDEALVQLLLNADNRISDHLACYCASQLSARQSLKLYRVLSLARCLVSIFE